MGIKYNNLEDVIAKAESTKGKKVSELIISEDNISATSKGNIGHIIEKELFGLKINNKQAPDFEKLGVELKVTGYRWVFKGTKVSAKERLVITMIDYFKDYKTDFYSSHLYSKISKTILMLYEYDPKLSFLDYVFTHNYLYEFNKIPEKDRLIILNDWKTIQEKIKSGLAHELSEGDTMYLGAAPKGQNSKSLVEQPFSNIRAMVRAYSLKTTYMTYLLRDKVFNKEETKESLIKDLAILRNSSLEQIIDNLFKPYIGKTLSQIDIMVGENLRKKRHKQILWSYTSRMLEVFSKDYEHIEEFEKANIVLKTINLESNGNLKEAMSFPQMNFVEVANESWESSQLKEFFDTTKFLFVVYQKSKNKTEGGIFKGSFLWNMPPSIIETHIKKVWTEMNYVLNNEIELRIKSNKVYNNFPKSTDNPVSHVRPHTRKRENTSPLPEHTKINVLENDNSVDLSIYFDNHSFTISCFWLNRSYVLELIKNSNVNL